MTYNVFGGTLNLAQSDMVTCFSWFKSKKAYLTLTFDLETEGYLN